MKIKTILAVILAGSLAGCSNITSPFDEGYEFGDLTKTTLQVQAKYCTEADPVQRALMLTTIRSAYPDFPASGACSDLFELIPQDSVEDIAKEVDVERAIEDQKRFEDKVSK